MDCFGICVPRNDATELLSLILYDCLRLSVLSVLVRAPVARRIASDSDIDARVDQGERHTLRIPAVSHPGAARHGNWTVKDPPAVASYAFGGRLDSGDVYIIEPKRPRPICG